MTLMILVEMIGGIARFCLEMPYDGLAGCEFLVSGSRNGVVTARAVRYQHLIRGECVGDPR